MKDRESDSQTGYQKLMVGLNRYVRHVILGRSELF